MSLPRITITVAEQSDGKFRSDAVLPSGTAVTVVRDSREDAIKDAANKVHELAGQQVVTILPFCKPDWSLPYWELPKFRQYDPDRSDPEDDPLPLPTAETHGQDGATPLPVDAGTEGL